jgi:hypothetical protein
VRRGNDGGKMLGSKWTWTWSVWDITRWFVVFLFLGWLSWRFLFLGGMGCDRAVGGKVSEDFWLRFLGLYVLRKSLITRDSGP